MEIALRVHEADADEGNPEVARFLAVIAGQYAQPASVDRQRLVECELGGEVGDGSVRAGMGLLPPAIVRRACAIEGPDRGVVGPEELLVPCPLREKFRRDQPQHQDRVVSGLPPERVVQLAEDLPGIGVPRPPEIGGELRQSTKAIRYVRGLRLTQGNVHSEGPLLVASAFRLRQGFGGPP